jgi:putative toxin-antitoxin system antitoxin component (TIGR02293 family)
VFASALSLFEGDADAARRWLTTAQPALGGDKPLEYAATEVGAREVEDLIGRLEYGISS